ncbi:MAG: class I mannose-6-phosphate isomerase [Tannerella sp.]|nr:class I mannose-6-phosphate isomerase [Tannerella sp.]
MMYPFIFKPILKEIIWGGTEIRPFKGLSPSRETIGESWEISQVEGDCSVVANGALAGLSLRDLIERYDTQLVGKPVMQRFGQTFPLLVKFIDARDNLSVQVHPDDALAWERHASFGKTEMWYVVKAMPGAALYSGFSRRTNADEYVRSVEEGRLTDYLQRYEVRTGDVFFLPAGRVHAIGAGCFIAEIQQTSNITYRIYDYDRRDTDGNLRELHTEQARDAIDFTFQADYRTLYTHRINQPVSLVKCDYFTTGLLDLSQPLARDFSGLESFVIYICLAGQVLLRDDRDNELSLRQGQTALLPAATQTVSFKPAPHACLLETFVESR